MVLVVWVLVLVLVLLSLGKSCLGTLECLLVPRAGYILLCIINTVEWVTVSKKIVIRVKGWLNRVVRTYSTL